MRDETYTRIMKFIDMIYIELKKSCWLICSYHYSYTPISLYTEFQPPSINETKSFYLKCPHQNQNTTNRHDHVTDGMKIAFTT